MPTFGILHYTVFFLIVIGCLWMDLITHKGNKSITLKSAGLWSAVWIAIAIIFGLFIYLLYGYDFAAKFFTGYALEKSLAVDNLFVFIAIFSSFSVPDQYQHRVLYYGVLGAIIFRIIFITAGTALLALGDWVLIAFAVLIFITAYKMFQELSKDHKEIKDYSDHWSVRFIKKFVPVYPKFMQERFFVKDSEIDPDFRQGKKIYVTPLFLALLCVEIADVLFAFDSIPAIIAVTENTFLIITSNIFAILGLRSLYFLLSISRNLLCHLDKAVVALLFYIGIKLLLGALHIVHIDPTISLVITLSVLFMGIAGSFLFPKKVNS